MPCEFKSEDIGKHKVTTTQLAATEAIRLQMRLAKHLGGAVLSIMEIVENDNTTPFSQWAGQADEETILLLIKELISYANIDGKPLNDPAVFEEVFAGNILLAYKVAAFVFKANYGEMFEDLEVLKAQALSRLSKGSNSERTTEKKIPA